MSLPFARLRAASLALVLAVCLSNCAGSRGSGADVGCTAERANFMVTVDGLSKLASPAPGAGEGSLRLAVADLRSAIDRTESSFAAVRTCRVGQAELMRVSAASTRLAAERAAFDADLAAVREARAEIQKRQAALDAEVARLLASAPTSRARAARALAAVPPVPDPYVATDAAIIQARPDAASARICELRKGTRVESAGDAALPGWTALKLNDGSVGYVQTAYLRSVPLSPSAQLASARAQAARDPGNDPLVSLALAAQDGLTRRVGVFTSIIMSATESEGVDFRADAANPAPPAPPVPASS